MLQDSKTIPVYRRSARVTLIVLGVLFQVAPAGAEESLISTLASETFVDLVGATAYHVKAGKATAHPALGIKIGAELSAAELPVSAGALVQFETAPTAHGEDLWIGGGWARYEFSRWAVSTAAFYVKASASDKVWMHASELRFQPRPGHKLSLQALAAMGDARNPALELAYQVKFARGVSLTLGVGLGSERLIDYAGKAEIVWSLY